MGNLSLDIGLRALLTAQASLDTIGHNLANASTPGYSRQSVLTSPAPSLRLRGLIVGAGIQADVVQRTVDSLLHQRIVRQTSALSRLDARLAGMSDAEGFLNGSGAHSVGGLLQGFFAAVSGLSAAPQDATQRSGAVQSAVQLAQQLNQASAGAATLRGETALTLEAHVAKANGLAQQVFDLNHQVLTTEAGSGSANDVRDRRDEVLRELAMLVDVRAVEDPRGAVRVLVDGQLLVSANSIAPLSVERGPLDTQVTLRLGDSTRPLAATGGAIGGALSVLQDFLPRVASELDAFARNLVLETNRVHAIGIGGKGPFASLTATNAFADSNGNQQVDDELLAAAGLPFDVVSGALHLNVTEAATGAVTRHRIDVDAARTTVGQLVAALNSIGHLGAKVDGQGRLQLRADSGYGFDFSPRLDAEPDPIGSFGGGRASLATPAAGPFALSDGDTLDLAGPLGPLTVTFSAADFQQIGQATAAELAQAINAAPNVQANGLVASDVGGRLVLQTVGAGSAEGFTVAGGSALAALGLAPKTVAGHDTAADVRVSGTYTGAANGVLTFRPSGDGVVGTTPGLQVLVFDGSGAQVATLDVGAGYTPGDELDVLEGVRVAFGFATLSASDGDVFELDLVARPDTADLLPALGLNALFTGYDADTIGVRADLEADPALLAGALEAAGGDNGNLLRLLALDSLDVPALGGVTFGERFADLAGSVGLEISAATSARDAEQFLLDSLQARRDQISGVNTDEELANMIRQEQAYAAAGQFLRVVSDLNRELMNLI